MRTIDGFTGRPLIGGRSVRDLPRQPRQPRQPQRGAALVELALLLPVLLTLGFGMTEAARAIYEYDAIAKSVRSGVRHLSFAAPGDPVAIRQAVCLVVHGNTTCLGAPVAPGLDATMVSVCDRTNCPGHGLQLTGRGTVNLVSVMVTGSGFTPAVTWVYTGPIRFGEISATMVQTL